MIDFVKRNTDSILATAAVLFLTLGMLAHYNNYPYAWEIRYALWTVFAGAWIIVAMRNLKISRKRVQLAEWDFVKSIQDNPSLEIALFPLTQSKHSIVNWWRSFRGVQCVLLYCATFDRGIPTMRSYIRYLVTEKELFEMRLRGYCNTNCLAVVDKALTDPWLLTKSNVK